MQTGKLIRRAALAAMIAGAALAPTASAIGADVAVQVIKVAAGDSTARSVRLGVGKSIAIDLPTDVKDVLVGDPKIANAVVRSARRVYMIAVTVGQTNMFFFDAAGKQIAGFDIAVTRDLNGARAAIQQMLPDSDIRIEGVGDAVMLTGTAASPDQAQRAFDVASRLVGSDAKVVNNISVRGRDQVMLKVKVAEVKREVLKQLGVDVSASLQYGSARVLFNSVNPFVASGASPLSALASNFGVNPNITAVLRAMERAGVMRTLAEPSLTAISGETANFMAGGEIPIPVGLDCSNNATSCQPKIEFKKFGVSLAFTPVVLSAGRISLKVMTEVSNISYQNSINLQQNVGFSATIPSIETRRAETTVEIPSGGSLAMAGMIQQQTKQAINGFPGLMQIPILGTLFKSRDFINDQSELMVLITPYTVKSVAERKLSSPDDGFADPSDPSSVFLGRLNRIYGAAGKFESPANYHGKYGFNLD
jgi:pilus assembly protein CpaC